jgi:MFS family permease
MLAAPLSMREEVTSISGLPGPAAFLRDRRTWAAYLLLGLFAYLETSIGPAMPFLRAELGLGYAVASLHFSAFALGAIVAGLTGERWVRRIGRGRALWSGIGGMSLGVSLVALGPNVAITIAGAAMMGTIGTLSLMANQAVLSDIHGDLRAIALTESNVAATGTAIMAPLLIGGVAAAGWGWQFGLLVTVPWALALWWVFRDVRFPEAVPVPQGDAGGGRLPGTFWLLWVVLFLVSAAEWCVAYWSADFLASVVGLGHAAAATATTLFFVAMTSGRLIGSRLARHFRAVSLLLTAIGVALSGFFLFWLAAHPLLNLVGLFIAGLGIANLYPLTVATATGVVPHRIDQATARLAVATGTALLVGPFAVGALSDAAGMRWGFGIVVPVLILAFGGVLTARRRLGTPAARTTAAAAMPPVG